MCKLSPNKNTKPQQLAFEESKDSEEEQTAVLLVKQGRALVKEINKGIRSLKEHVTETSSKIASEMNKVSMKELNQLELERQKVMRAIDYLQNLRIQILIQMDEAKEQKTPNDVNFPYPQEISERVQRLLSYCERRTVRS